MPHAQVDIFARLPVPGKVKTRLAVGLDDDAAAKFYAACAAHVCRQCSRCSTLRSRVLCSSASEVSRMQDWLASRDLALPCTHQLASPDLGTRMQAALHHTLGQEGVDKAIVIGTDIPDITAELLDRAVKALEQYEVVLGPAVDGGYYLIGVSKAPQALFQNVQWSTDKVLQQTLAQAEQLHLNVAPMDSLPTLQDIDTVEDLQQWHATSAKQESEHPLLPLITSLLQSHNKIPRTNTGMIATFS